MQSEDQVYFLKNRKLTRGLCYIKAFEKFRSRKSSK